MSARKDAPYRFDDFTERSYASLLRAARAGYRFERFGTDLAGPHILLRHDVDMSVHRALRIAAIEARASVRVTYFLQLRSPFYDLLEAEIAARVRRIADLGHAIGLHFHAGVDSDRRRTRELERSARAERALLEDVAGVAVNAVSFHDPSARVLARFDGARFAGMLNVYGAALRSRYKYCSDSNGYWRFDRLRDLLDPEVHSRLHVLTHPEWWVPKAQSPFARVRRCVDGRRDATLAAYVGELRRDRRRNVGAPAVRGRRR